MENYFFLENYSTSEGAVSRSVLYYQQLPITRYQVRFMLIIILSNYQQCPLPLKTLDTIGNCQRPVFSLGVSQHMHKITKLWKFELNWSLKLRDNNERKKHPNDYFESLPIVSTAFKATQNNVLFMLWEHKGPNCMTLLIIGTFGSKEFRAYIKCISQVSRELSLCYPCAYSYFTLLIIYRLHRKSMLPFKWTMAIASAEFTAKQSHNIVPR